MKKKLVSPFAKEIREAALTDLLRQRFRFFASASCRFCKRDIEWWKTSKGKLIPLTRVNLEPHWDICPRAFKNEPPPSPQGTLLEQR